MPASAHPPNADPPPVATPPIRVFQSQPGRFVFVEMESDDAWMASDLTVSVPR